MPVIYRDPDANLGLLVDRQIAVLGYGNMGRALALNLRDSAFPILLGNRQDTYANLAYQDGFEVLPIADAAAQAEIILVMLPDEIASEIYLREIAPGLKPNDTLVFTSAYNISFGFIEPPPFVDVVLVAPQTVGEGVREGYVEGSGYPSFVAVRQDASGHAWDRVLAIAKALGALHQGALEITFQQEAELDLFAQQALLPAIFSTIQTALEVLLREGFPPDTAAMSLYLSGELGYILTRWAERGILPSLELHARTGQFGLLSHIDRFREVKLKQIMENVLDTIRRGDFAQEWAADYADGYPRLEGLRRRLAAQSIWEHEREVLAQLRPGDTTPPRPPGASPE